MSTITRTELHPEPRLVPMTEATARHLLDVLVVPWQANWEEYDWARHREVIIWLRKHWPDLFKAHEAWHWVEASYDPYPSIEEPTS